MSEGKNPATEDRERLERYLGWRRAALRRQAARRQRLSRYITVTGLAVIGLALVTWRLERGGDGRTPIGFVRHEPPQSVGTGSHDQMRAPLGRQADETVVGRTSADAVPRLAVRRTPRTEPRERASGANMEPTLPPRQPLAPLSPIPQDHAPVPDSAVGLRVPDSSRGTDPEVSTQPSTPTAAIPPSVADSSASIGSATSTNPKPDDPQTVAPPPPESEAIPTAVTPPNVPDAVPREGYSGASVAQRPEAPYGEPKRRAAADSVAVWLKGEVQEFRDGVEHEVRDFRAGVERLRRALERFGPGRRSD